MKRFILLISLLAVLAPITSYAVDAGKINSLQMPAWLERDGSKQALRADTILQSGDILSTGTNARVLVTLEEGSSVKLGENGELKLNTLRVPDKKEGLFEGVMNVLKGAFRFTTNAISKNRHRDVRVRIGVITAGIRGTDIWGSSKSDKDILSLIEGNITVQKDGEAEFTMKEDKSLYIVPQHKAALPIQTVSDAQLTDWANETELQSGQGIISSDGRWAVNLMSLSSEPAAETVQNKMDNKGYAVDIKNTQINGTQWYRVRIEGFITRKDASAFAFAIDGQMDIQQAWVEKI